MRAGRVDGDSRAAREAGGAAAQAAGDGSGRDSRATETGKSD